MRVEFNLELEDCEVPCFSVETTEGPHKLFQLSTLVLNVIEQRGQVDCVFHCPNEADLPKKIESFTSILTSAPNAPDLEFTEGKSGSLGSYHYRWLSIHANGAGD